MGVSCECHFPVKSIFVLFFGLLRFSSLFTPLFRCPFVQSLLPFCLFSTKPCVLPIFPPHLSWAFLRSFCGCGRVSFLFTSHESLANALHYFVLYWRRVAACQRAMTRSEEHTSELQSPCNLVCRLLLA